MQRVYNYNKIGYLLQYEEAKFSFYNFEKYNEENILVIFLKCILIHNF